MRSLRRGEHPRRLTHGEDVEHCHWAPETRERHVADWLHLDVVLDLRKETLGDQDLAARRLVGEPRGEIRHRADRGIVGAALEADFPQVA